ncbi:uncharacterized protein [Clytia hemisphaerica]|uniref:uncharacterized protein n=1 Tax=Clytia hemisphaerica TaxID=252671 RepID=UPI0034D57483
MESFLQIIIILSSSFFIQVQALQCFTCSAYNGDICKATQQYHACSEENAACLTMTYKSLLNGKEKTYFQKKCINGSSKCEANCQNLQDSYVCMASCCRDNLCNLETDKKTIWFALLSPSSSVDIQRLHPLSLLVLMGNMLIQQIDF